MTLSIEGWARVSKDIQVEAQPIKGLETQMGTAWPGWGEGAAQPSWDEGRAGVGSLGDALGAGPGGPGASS